MGGEDQRGSRVYPASDSDFEFLTFLILMSFMLIIPSIYLRAAISILSIATIHKLRRRNINLGNPNGALASSALAFLMTLPFLTLADLRYTDISQFDVIRIIPQQLAIAVWEECFFRGVLSGSAFQFILSSMFFSLLHSLNPGFGILPLINLFIIGVFLCLLRIRYGLLASISFHFSWNTVSEHLWGFPTSGILGISVFTSKLVGPSPLTGGKFGPEGSLIALIEFAICTLTMVRKFFIGHFSSVREASLMDPELIRVKILGVLKFITDPEIPINIVDLGLIREMRIEDGRVQIKMVMTAPGCPYSMILAKQVEESVKQAVPEVEEISVEVVTYPPWTPADMTEEGRELFRRNYGYDIMESFIQRYGSIENYYKIVREYLGESEE